MLLQSNKSVITTKDFIPGVSYKNNFDSALVESTLIFVIWTIKLLNNPTCDSDVGKAITYCNSNGKEKLIPILLEKCKDPSLEPISGITCDRSKDQYEDMLAKDLDRAYKFHENRLHSTSHLASREAFSNSGVTSRTGLGINKEKISTKSRKLKRHKISPDTISGNTIATGGVIVLHNWTVCHV